MKHLERIAMLLDVYHSTLEIPKLRQIHNDALEELLDLQADQIVNDEPPPSYSPETDDTSPLRRTI